MTYLSRMHSVVEMPTFISDCDAAGLSDEEREDMVAAIGVNPHKGDMIQGTGGCRKRRFGGRGRGKSGGYRTDFAAADVPIAVLALIDKGERDNISKAERNEIKAYLSTYADDYREGVRKRIAEMKGKRL